MKIGLDIGSTTLKAVVLDDSDQIIYSSYRRHYSKITESAALMLREIDTALGGNASARICISGSAGMGIAEQTGLTFVQEVYATRLAANVLQPDCDVIIELGGEDAKILFLTGEMGGEDLEVRMNGSCAGGTGAFIDQMATLLGITPDEMNDLAAFSEKTYTIASRCGVFAKSDIQPLMNQGARKQDIASSIFLAVVNQTVAGLAQGRALAGNVLYLGGPLTFLPQLRSSFDSVLNLRGICPENSLYFVAIGAAMRAAEGERRDISACAGTIGKYSPQSGYISCRPLFESAEEYTAFAERHSRNRVEQIERPGYDGKAYIGLDAGSTTFKAVAIDEDGKIIDSCYMSAGGNPVALAKEFISSFYNNYPAAKVCASAVTGYGEDIIKNAFSVDFGIVETIAHFTAARAFQPDVDFIIDIGGQDIKCFKIRGGAIDNIFLNEACSSGCGSFLQTFAGAWNMPVAEFAKKGLMATRPVDLGSRCTVFMNSSVKQAQKDGALIEDISAGLSISVVKNALYKVVRAANADQLGKHIVVQGGTFLNDAVLRAFEQEIGRQVVRPNIAGLMGAYGAALYAKMRGTDASTLITPQGLEAFTHTITPTVCSGCQNHCRLTVNTFSSGNRFIGGNRCERAFTKKDIKKAVNIYDYKRELLASYTSKPGRRGRIGIPMGLNMYELYPFFHTFFSNLGFEPVISPPSNRELYLTGQKTIPSDTVCYPAKLMHGHIDSLLDSNVDAIFYPCLTYNIDEGRGDNHYNCPVVAYYPEVIKSNIAGIGGTAFIYDYITLTNERLFVKQMRAALRETFGVIPADEIKRCYRRGLAEYRSFLDAVRKKGRELMLEARASNMPVIILAGRPYHLDGEVNHGIDTLICGLGAAVLSEDSVSTVSGLVPTVVLDQWTYHSRLYAAAQASTELGEDVSFVQLVSFGCGLDAVTTDEARRILEQAGQIYTQIKIDEITNLGAVKIRLRSLFAALEMASSNAGKEVSF